MHRNTLRRGYELHIVIQHIRYQAIEQPTHQQGGMDERWRCEGAS